MSTVYAKEAITKAIALGIHRLGLPEDVMVQIEVLMPDDKQEDTPRACDLCDVAQCDPCPYEGVTDAEDEEFEETVLATVCALYDISEEEAAIKLYLLGSRLADRKLESVTIEDIYG